MRKEQERQKQIEHDKRVKEQEEKERKAELEKQQRLEAESKALAAYLEENKKSAATLKVSDENSVAPQNTRNLE